MKFIVKVSPEITIKSKFVRKQAIKMLARNIKKHIKKYTEDFDVIFYWDKIEVTLPYNNSIIKDVLSQIPWIEYFLEIIEYNLWKITKEELFDKTFLITKDYYLDKVNFKTFCVRVKRVWNHDFKSIDLERYIWWWLLKDSIDSKVKLKNPEVEVKLEIKDNKFYIIKKRYNSIWWYPVWFQGRVISLISWWFDSSVSTFQMMKRWCKVNFLFFNLWWKSHELWVKQIAHYLWNTFSYSYQARFITIPFEEVIEELLIKVNHKYRWVILKRYMLDIASRLYNYEAIIKWDSLWQVSSQTLKNMHIIDKASTNLVFRPLIGFNKQEIINITKDIWTYNYSVNMPEYCAIISDKPSTWAKLEDILREEKNIDTALLDKVYENKKVEKVKDIIKNDFIENKIEISRLPWEEDIIIDIREVSDIKKRPLNINNVEIIKIPFFEIIKRFKNLSKKYTYLLYCDKWIISKSYVEDLIWKWFKNIKVYRPMKDLKICKIKSNKLMKK